MSDVGTLIYLVFRYPGTTFMDHIERYQDNPDVKMIVMLGEVGDGFLI